MLIPNSPDHAGTIADLYKGREPPGVLVRLMTDRPWCDQVQEYVSMDGSARAHRTPEAGNDAAPCYNRSSYWRTFGARLEILDALDR